MAKRDDEEFSQFVIGVLDQTCSSAFGEDEIDSENEDILLHNVGSDSDSDNYDVDQIGPNISVPLQHPQTSALLQTPPRPSLVTDQFPLGLGLAQTSSSLSPISPQTNITFALPQTPPRPRPIPNIAYAQQQNTQTGIFQLSPIPKPAFSTPKRARDVKRPRNLGLLQTSASLSPVIKRRRNLGPPVTSTQTSSSLSPVRLQTLLPQTPPRPTPAAVLPRQTTLHRPLFSPTRRINRPRGATRSRIATRPRGVGQRGTNRPRGVNRGLTRGNQQQLPRQPGTPWVDVTNYDPGPSRSIPIFNINQGPNLPQHFDYTTEPIEYFSLFFNNDLMTHICTETNLFANKRKAASTSPHARCNKWEALSVGNLKAFLGTVINMGLIPLPSIESYFSTAWESTIPFFRDVFSKDEFLNIFWCLHFNHDDTQRTTLPTSFLIKPVLEHIKATSRLFYAPTSYVAVDESTISFKGKVSFKVYNPNKPTKFGLKVFVLSDSANGYFYDFLPYFGKSTLIPNTTLLKTTQIVKVLAESVVLKDPASPVTGLHVYIDRYYNSPELATELLKINCWVTGTVMTNRSNMPPNLKRRGKQLGKGEILALRQDNLLSLTWKDKRAVHMLSTKHKGSAAHMTDVQSRWPNKPPTPKPHVIIDYTKHMGGVDRGDHFVSSYQFMRRTKKWYRKLFFWLLEIAIINSYILYKVVQTQSNHTPLTHFAYRKSLVRELVKEKVAQRPKSTRKRGRPAQGPPEERLHGRHFMQRRPRSTRCIVCHKKGLRKETVYFCKTCTDQPNLHPEDCFELYHTLAKYY